MVIIPGKGGICNTRQDTAEVSIHPAAAKSLPHRARRGNVYTGSRGVVEHFSGCVGEKSPVRSTRLSPCLKIRKMSTVTIEEAQAKLSELIHRLRMDEEVVIIENSRPVARLTLIQPRQVWRKLGTLQGTVLNMAPDFDAPLEEDFKEYMS